MKMNNTARYAVIQALYNIIFAAVAGFASVYLLDAGLSNTQIGILIAVSGVIAAVLQPVIGSYADRPTSPSEKNIMLPIVISMVLLSVTLLIARSGGMILTVMTFAMGYIGTNLLESPLNSLGMESINQGKKVNFGVARGIGALAYAIAAYTLGHCVDLKGTMVVPITMIITYILMALAVKVYPFEKQIHPVREDDSNSKGNIFSFFLRYPKLTIVLVGVVFIYTSHVMLDYFAFQIVESKGGGSSQMGMVIAIASAVELPVMFSFGYMVRRVRCDIWFRISGIFFALKALGALLAPTVSVLYAVQLFQMFGYALFAVSAVFYINSVVQKQDRIKGQGYISMVMAFGSVIGSLTGGRLIDLFGITIMLICAVLSAVAGTAMLFVGAEKVEIDS